MCTEMLAQGHSTLAGPATDPMILRSGVEYTLNAKALNRGKRNVCKVSDILRGSYALGCEPEPHVRDVKRRDKGVSKVPHIEIIPIRKAGKRFLS